MRKYIAMCCVLLLAARANAQTKVFNEVGNEISSKMKVIMQDENLMGYLVFTQLEQTSEDSFNYRISLMDENLNDIGTVTFRNEKLNLQAVSFEQDILCLAYLKSGIDGHEFRNLKTSKKEAGEAKSTIVVQLLGLNGKIIKTNEIPVSVKNTFNLNSQGKISVDAYLQKSIQVKNIPGQGFACLYGDNDANNLITYNLSGEKLWSKKMDGKLAFAMLTSGSDIYLLGKNKINLEAINKNGEMIAGGYQLNSYSFADGSASETLWLKDRQGNDLRVLSFDNDPLSGKPVIAGNIIDPKNGNKLFMARSIAQSPYCGVFTIAVNGPTKADRKEYYSYWNDGSLAPAISERGRFENNHAYCNYAGSFRDFEGNTYFVGSSIIKKMKWGTIASSVVLSPLVVVSPFLLATGTQKCKVADAMLLKQNAKGVLSFENTIPCNSSKYVMGRAPVSYLNTKSFYTVSNAETKSNYVIVDDTKDIVIYNATQKKIMRTVPHKDGRITTNIFPAKEGYVMVEEYSLKDKYLKLSIESL